MQEQKQLTEWRRGQLQKLYDELAARGQEGLTRKQAADLLGVGKSVYVTGLLEELVELGHASKTKRIDLKHEPVVYTFKAK